MVRCERCGASLSRCLCSSLTPIATERQLVLVQHVLELHKVSNTGRIAALVLPNLERHVYGAADGAPLDSLASPGTWLLYPTQTLAPSDPTDVKRLVVLDASWSQARKMVQRVAALRTLPRLGLSMTATPSLRTAPPGGMSTLQAIAHSLHLLGEREPARQLEAVHQMLVNRVVGSRGYL